MAATRLSDSQKTQLVDRFRGGGSSQELAEAFGCSPNTVNRVVRTALGEEAYERLKRQRTRRRSQAAEGDSGASETLQTTLGIPESEPLPGEAVVAPAKDDVEDGPGVLAIEDADDFAAEDDDDLLTDEESSDEDLGQEDGLEAAMDPFQPIPVALLDEGEGEAGDARLQTLRTATLPASAYMLVDKTVELQARPLSEFPELGRLPADEMERQALVVFLNPRQAKRQCGRTQRVIKVPDLRVLERTAPYLLAQGISRVVIEGALYALPGS
ncbi:MAG: hypothetical protein ER33_15625 [Cyanobium sp. CACIAM 14]|nr:MAG: hypothetical protein ER33_15625 [Cyanobium sp. CACIAM 14]